MKKEDIDLGSKAYIVGGGIASLATATYLIKHGNFPGKNITLFEEFDSMGGSFDAFKSKKGYVMRGYRMFEDKVYSATYDFMSIIPSLKNSRKTLRDDFIDFNKHHVVCSKCRLVEHGKKIEANHFQLDWKDRGDIVRLMALSEQILGDSKIKDNFSPDFFKTNYWYEMGTTFAFQPWHSAVELRRYLHRFLQDSLYTDTLRRLKSTSYNQYDSVVLPTINWLRKKGVNFKTNTSVLDLDFDNENNGKVKTIHYNFKGKKKSISVTKRDYVFATIGSMTANSSIGSMNSAPKLNKKPSSSWTLWENISKKNQNFGRPSVFNKNVPQSNFVSFTITADNTYLPKLIEEFSGNKAGEGGIITFKDSNWGMSLIVPHQPHFINQPKNKTIICATVLYKYRKYLEAYINEFMSKLNGPLIMVETWMVNGTDHWFITPSEWEHIPKERQDLILKDLFEDKFSLSTPYPNSILDSVRRKMLSISIPKEFSQEEIIQEKLKLEDYAIV